MLRRVATSVAGQFRPALPSLFVTHRGEKTSTNIVGLDFDPNARENLVKACHEVLSSVQASIPAEALYRKNLEQTMAWKLKVLELNPENGAAEEVLGFQLEQEIDACQKELSLIPQMAEWKPWETENPEVEDVPYGKIDEALKKYGMF
mmetsp:Transcript_14882/g.41832  ORF Transcript_14882/g.41832 Transcript_14882/m.41832 type:complete len:148 (-) Transcript_14882:240-683(-)|eukprot:CAMPEP_0117663510 /NCGR_PEP_ID=MMETSP0804-20121206/8651_1 /TAXON_ID=1074897 /ORGANISM="Tetraselmis astigmatica, Strain CCMP880" /LENGTH=147 /DNA_ID=CAMNT_0005470533 /DNA_START=97 /DNA_END=540 /DNA_ORIENTATION=-